MRPLVLVGGAALGCVLASQALGGTLPGGRPGVSGADASVAADPAVSEPVVAESMSAAPGAVGRSTARGCPQLRLPWGPIESCTTAVVVAGAATSAVVGMAAWWGQGFDARFSVAREGWFGSGTYAGGVDKLGHAYLGIALNLTELLDRSVFRGDARGSRVHRWTTEALRYVQPPGTAVALRRTWRP